MPETNNVKLLPNSFFVEFDPHPHADWLEKMGTRCSSYLHKGWGYTTCNPNTLHMDTRIANWRIAFFALTVWLPVTLVGLAAYYFSKSHSAAYAKAQEALRKAQVSPPAQDLVQNPLPLPASPRSTTPIPQETPPSPPLPPPAPPPPQPTETLPHPPTTELGLKAAAILKENFR